MAFPLNPAQQAAVEHPGGPLLIIAGAGSGKTRVITQRITRLIEQGNSARNIFAVTFTNKASDEMAERLEHQVGAVARDVWISTFHALGAEILRREAKHVAAGEKYVVYDAADTLGVVKEILRELKLANKSLDPSAILSRISHAKNALIDPKDMPIESDYDEVAVRTFPRYVAAMKRLNALDFDDLILVPLKLLREVPELRERWHRDVRHLLVDEFQDTSIGQLLFVQALAGARREVFCVGDDDQSIYGWRGAEVKNVIEFGRYFPGSRMVALEQNYRSRQPILDVANAVIKPSVRAYPKTLFSDKKQGEKPVLVECDTHESEVRFVLETMQRALNDGLKRSDIAVLYRSNGLAKPFEEALRLANISYKLIGGTSFYERREVKDLTAYLRLAVNAQDDLAFRRVVNYPTRGIGDTSFERIERHARARGLHFLEASRDWTRVKDLDERAGKSLTHFVSIINGVTARIEANQPIAEVARLLASEIGLYADIITAGPTEKTATKRWGNVEEFIRTLEKSNAKGPKEVRSTLAKLSLRMADEEKEDAEQVILSSLHGSKGLEFSLVFLIGCDDGIMPHARVDTPKATDIIGTLDPAEERRLFYVGVTRAKDRLFMLRAKTRAYRGGAKPMAASRFFRDIPPELFERRSYVGQPILANPDMAARARAALETLAKLRAGRVPG
ncbi:MAG: UvrD-helicase domain-containing protein [Deltaproteobacteria bacterium]|nr:UvrD-helicase domain-containing protein [Deltaproteobacteria bacterium]